MRRSISGITGLCLLLLASCRQEPERHYLLESVPAQETGIGFINRLEDSQEFNIVEYLYFYNGGGVAVGDINNDGLDDLYFSSNQQGNKLYLNKGNFKFEDITEKSGTAGSGNWKTGVSMADIDQDGFTDIFVCGVGGYKKFNGRNQVFLNNGDLSFRDATDELGLDFQGFSTQTIFLDADGDGDLDLYLLNHSVHTVRSMGNIDLRYQSNRAAGDKLYENRLVPDGKVRFREVTGSSGLFNSALGYGLGIAAADLNNDGSTDLYVSNDFHENDYLYLGSGNGTFRQSAERSLGHSSRFSMGNEVADLNNDGRMDILTLDMLPWKEDIIKASAGEDPYDIFQYKLRLGFHHQYARNALQLNTGNAEDGTPLFVDIAPLAGIEATDWSWAPLAADFDNDGWQDLFISNGIMRRPNDMDYISFISTDSAQRNLTFGAFIKRMPEGKVPDKIFRNSGDLTFQNENGNWIAGMPDLSNGAAYSDLDNDGDLDLVVNTINEPAKVYRNRSDSSHYLQVRLEGPATNREAIGSTVVLYQGAAIQVRQLQPVRGFQSSVTTRLHFGLGSSAPDSLAVQWPDGSVEVIRSPKPDSYLTITWRNRGPAPGRSIASIKEGPRMFKQLPDGPVHSEDEFSAFGRERLLPHATDAPGPATVTGDFNHDGLDDLFISNGAGKGSSILLGTPGGPFRSMPLRTGDQDAAAAEVLDANGDKKDDLLIVPGGQEHAGPPMIFLQQGGRLVFCADCIPSITLNGSCAVALDIDRDGDQDLFLGASVVPGRYGESPKSFFLLNNGKGKFLDAGNRMFPDGNDTPGMVTAAQRIEFNNDGYPDLVLAGEWMRIRVLINDRGTGFHDETEQRGLANTEGWWHGLVAADVDHDGDTDLVAGNHGINHRLRANAEEPVGLTSGDFDKNGSTDQLLTYFNDGIQTPFVSRDQLVKQLPVLKKHYLRYSSFKVAGPAEIMSNLGDPPARQLRAVTFQSLYLENNGGTFKATPLPSTAQLFPVHAIRVLDVNRDGVEDLLLGGNLHQVMTEIGRLDAGNGLVLIGKGNGRFEPRTGPDTGFLLEGVCRSISVLRTANGDQLVAAGMNGSPLKWFILK